ncbi:unnamed protein product [Lactuca saligna]|uniref:Ubiquitin-like protease family profile domain-containing protein n=1 Tax=Lactuca saligna TaxID=75948 RepID=A0AA36A4G5_LACSI|nr:unnamed protein product [Lactuca saligna]
MKRKRAYSRAKNKTAVVKKPLQNTAALVAENHVMNVESEEPEDATPLREEPVNPSTSTTMKRGTQEDAEIEKTGYGEMLSHPNALSQIIASVIKEITKDAGGLTNLSRSLIGNSVSNGQMKQPHADIDHEENQSQHHQNPEYKQEELNAALRVIKRTMKLNAAEPFNKPVDPIALGIPDYFDVIETPMDFGTICNNLENGVKYMNSGDVFKDVEYIWSNCVKYNKKGDAILELMKRVKTYFMKYWKSAKLQSKKSPPVVESSVLRHKEEEKEKPQTSVANNSAHLQQKETGQPQQNSNQPQSSSSTEEDEPNPESTVVKKKRRFQGPTPSPELVKRIKIRTNKRGKPVGPGAAQLTSLLGAIACDVNFAPLTYYDWKKIPQQNKDNMWQEVLTKFDIDPDCRRWVMLSIKKNWRTFKSHLKANHYDVHENDEDRLADRDERVPPDQWSALVSQWSSKKSQVAFRDIESGSSDHDEDSKQRALMIKLKAIKEKIVITYNKKGVPIGDEAAKLATFEGFIARTMVPITCASWKDISKEKKEELWQCVLMNFVLDPKSRKHTLQSLGKKWRNFKHYLYDKYIKAYKNDPEVNLLNPPDKYPFLKKEDWKLFVEQRLSDKWEEKSNDAKKVRAHHKYNHRLSRKGYARLIVEIMQQTGKTEEEIDRTMLWKKARETKEGGYDPDVKVIVDKMEELQNSESCGEITYGTNDVLTQALGTQENRGRVRGMGKYVAPHQYFLLPKTVKQYLDLENKKLDQRFSKLEGEIEKLKRGVNPVSEGASRQMWGNADLQDQPLDNSCYLALDVATNIVAKGTITKDSVSDENIEVMMETSVQGEALLPVPLEEEFIVKVKDAVGHILSWPRYLVIRCSDLEKVMAKPIGKPVKEELKSKKEEKRQRESDEENEKGKETEKGREMSQRRRTRAQMRTRIRIENNRVLKMTALMVDAQLLKAESIKVQCEDDLFGYESYTYLSYEDFEVVFTLDELTGVVITCYMMYLFEQIKNGPKSDHGICFVSPTAISPRARKDKLKNIADASKSVADRLSTRKDNDLILLPYNPGRHWVLAVLDMKTATCYYLDSLRPNNVNSQLKNIIEAAMVLYATQSGSNKKVKLNWINVACPRQPGGTECGFYMLKFMKEIVEEGVEVLVNKNVGGGKDMYTDADIDELREEWAYFVTNFIFR